MSETNSADNRTDQSDSLVDESWEKVAVGSGILGIVSVLFLPVITLNIPDMGGMMASQIPTSFTLGDIQSFIGTVTGMAGTMSSATGTGGVPPEASLLKTAVDAIFYASLAGSALLIVGGVKKRTYAGVGAVLLALPVVVLAYTVMVFIPETIAQEASSSPLGSMGGTVASNLIGTGMGTYGLIAAAIGGIVSATGNP